MDTLKTLLRLGWPVLAAFFLAVAGGGWAIASARGEYADLAALFGVAIAAAGFLVYAVAYTVLVARLKHHTAHERIFRATGGAAAITFLVAVLCLVAMF